MKKSRAFLLLTACSVVLLNSCRDSSTAADPPLLTLDECLSSGTFIMFQEGLDLLVASLFPIEGIRVPEGNLFISFHEDGTFLYNGDFLLHMDIDSTGRRYMEAESVFRTDGNYTVTNGKDSIRFQTVTSESQALVWRAREGSDLAEVPGGGPNISVSLPSIAPYRCTDATLEIDTTGTSGRLTMFFDRVVPR